MIICRDTPAAKIFRMKSEEDFRHSIVVTRLFKVVAWIVIILLNLFFVFFSMLRGLQRGYDWQVKIIIQFLKFLKFLKFLLLEIIFICLYFTICG